MKPHVDIRFYRQASPTGMSYPAHHRLHRHRAVHHPDAGDGSVAAEGGVGQGDA
ncbi:MAG: hypothetical protein PUB29_06420 [Bacteroidales bacterium]|nr:hypothetical protein [Bacteroidales bacterium]